MPLTDTEIAALKEKHGQHLAAVTVADGSVLVFRKPKRQEYDHWFEKRESAPQSAARELAQQCLVFPGYDALLSTLDSSPAVLSGNGGIMDALLDLAGLGGATQKKL